MVYALDQSDGVIDDDLGDSFEFHDDKYSLSDVLENKNTKNNYLWLKES